MSLSAKNSMESPRRKFFMNTTCIMSESRNQTFLGSEVKMSLSAKSPLQSAIRKGFMNSTYIMSIK